MEDAQDPSYMEEDVESQSDGRREQVNPQTLEESMCNFNDMLVKVQEEHNQINITILQSIIDM